MQMHCTCEGTISLINSLAAAAATPVAAVAHWRSVSHDLGHAAGARLNQWLYVVDIVVRI